MRVAVVGCGIFGATAAIRLADAGHDVVVLERNARPLEGASFNNQNRLHLGYHYPRDEETAAQCVNGFRRFREEFAECVVEVRDCAYFVASTGSLTTATDYLAFAKRIGDVKSIDLSSFRPIVRDVDVGVSVPEVVYDCGELRAIMERRLARAGASLRLRTEVVDILRQEGRFVVSTSDGQLDADFVVNCTYADVNRLGAMLGHPAGTYQYEHTVIPIIEWDQPPVAITIMDGPFVTVMPFGRSGRFLLYHVEQSVIAREVATQLPVAWREVQTPTDLFVRMIAAGCAFIPSLSSARQIGELRGPRVVLANRDATDARPSIIQNPEPGFVNVFSSKVDHCTWVADEIARKAGGSR